MPKTTMRATAFDKLVGERIRDVRLSRGISQSKLGKLIGVTFQQVQKYEAGHNRIGASRLYMAAMALGMTIDELCRPPAHKRKGTQPRPDITGVPQTRLTYELFRHALALPADRRRVLLDMARSAAG
jgi:transcriptional regulator with XRE-family HTH domain